MPRARVPRQIFAYNQPKIQWSLSGFIYRQLFFDHRRKLFADFVELFIFRVRRKLTCNLGIAQRNLFIAHIQQPVGVRIGQCPGSIEVTLYRLAQTLGKYAVFIHIDSGTNKLVYVAIIANPQIDSLLSPTDDTVQLAL